jgi:hypothetical protein
MEAVQVTASLAVVPWIFAVNCILALGDGDAAVGDTATEATGEPAGAPFPWSGSTTGRCFASVTIVRVPSTAVAVVAANLTVKLAPWPGERVRGSAIPVALKPVPMTAVCVMLMLAVPIFATDTTCEAVLPTGALTESVLGVTDKGGSGSATPTHPAVQAPIARIVVRTIGTNTLLLNTDISIHLPRPS